MRIELPTGLTFPTIQAGLDAEQLDGLNSWLTSKGMPTVSVGDANPFFLELMNFPAGGAPFDKSAAMNGLTKCGPITNTGHFKTLYLDLITEIKGDIYDFPVFFEFTDESDLDNEVPATFPNRTYQEVDPDDAEQTIEQTHTWRTWESTHAITELGGKWYKSSETSQEAIPVSAWIESGLTYKTVGEYRDLQSENSPVDP